MLPPAVLNGGFGLGFDKPFRSREQTYSFNCPYQCGTGAPDEEKKAMNNSHTIEDKDIIMLFTDGISDNVYNHVLIDIIR